MFLIVTWSFTVSYISFKLWDHCNCNLVPRVLSYPPYGGVILRKQIGMSRSSSLFHIHSPPPSNPLPTTRPNMEMSTRHLFFKFFLFVFHYIDDWHWLHRFLHFQNKIEKKNFSGEQGWRSRESTRLPPLWPGFDSRTGRHMWVEFVVGSLLCSERFFSGYSGFPLSAKTNISKFQFDPECSSV